MLESLLSHENAAIVVLVAWVVTLKMDVKYYREQTKQQWQLINKMTAAVQHVQQHLQLAITQFGNENDE